jgi:thiol-disulfide isomerase/thioredoxin
MNTKNVSKKLLVCAIALCVGVGTTIAQEKQAVSLKIGDPAPAIRYSKWIKGEPINALDPAQLYVLEFWATWCGPCKLAMPHLTKLQEMYKGKATFIGVGVWEKVPEGKPYESSLPAVEKFVKGNAANMGYAVIADNNEQFMGNHWLKAAGENGIPSTFIVRNNKVIWIGHPNSLDSTLPKILDGSYNMEQFATVANKRAEAGRKQAAEMAALFAPIDSAVKAKDYTKAFALMEEMGAKKPEFKPSMNYMKLRVLLSYDEKAAIDLAKELQKESKSVSSILLGEVYTREGLSKETYLWVAKNVEEVKMPPNPVVSNALAATYAKGGDYKKAVLHQEKAVEEAKLALKEGKMIGTIMDYTVVEYEKSLAEYKKKLQ